MFTMAGRVNPSAFYLVMQVTLLFALSRPVGARIALRRAAVWLVPAAMFAPFARTIEPAHVIDDPALMLDGGDPQLERAIAEVMKSLQDAKPRDPARPAYPRR